MGPLPAEWHRRRCRRIESTLPSRADPSPRIGPVAQRVACWAKHHGQREAGQHAQKSLPWKSPLGGCGGLRSYGARARPQARWRGRLRSVSGPTTALHKPQTSGWRRDTADSRYDAATLSSTEQVKPPKSLQQEIGRLKRLVADLTLENAIFRETVAGIQSARQDDSRRCSTCARALPCQNDELAGPSIGHARWPAARAGSRRYRPEHSVARERLTESIARLAAQKGDMVKDKSRPCHSGKAGK
jgi:hypothetical protein